ncbi:hypothetical protein E2C01_041643 [Portunus trituberculatus]|uniref:Uncharacterized protein n=1 Tax=Portunus trituberculatus TaxID=210409 RepID=A0A5B7FN38_PORTR|nr:hypothetical protein [Portunus trituberculatus]
MASLSRDEPKYQVSNFSIFLTKLTNLHLNTELIPSITTPLQFLTRSTALQQLLYALKPSLPATRPYVRAY